MNTRVDAFLTLLFLFLLSFPSPTAARTNTSTPSSNVSETISVLVTPSVDVTPSQQDPSLSESATMTMTAQMTNHSMTLSPRWVSESGPTSSSTLTLSGTEDLSETRSFRLSETISARTFSSERTETRTVSDSVTNDRSSSLTWDNSTFTSTNTMSVSNSSSRGSLTLSPSLTNTPSLTNSSSPSETQSPSLQGTPTYIRTYTQYTPTPNTSTFTSSPSISRSPTNTTSGPTPPMSASNTTTASLSLSTSASNSTSTSGSVSWSMTSSSSTSFSPTVFASPSKGSASPTTTGEMTISHLAPYTVPRAVYNTSTVVDQVFLARIQSFYIDPADISIPAFTRDLFRAMVAATTNASAAAGTPASSLYYLTESAAYVGNVLLVSVCQVDYVELDAGWNRFYNMSACRRDDVGPACTTTGSTSCKVKTVNYCNCSSLWQTYPPNSFVNLSTIPNYPEPPPTPAPTLVNNSGNHSSVNHTAAAEAASRRQFRSLDADSTNLVVQIQFSFLLQNAPAFRPKTQKDIIGNYTLLRKTLDTVLFGSYTDLHLAYFLLPGSGNVSNNSFFPTPPVIPVVRITSSSSFLPVMALLVFVAIGGGIVIHKLYKYIRWRMTVGRFRVAPRDSSSNNVDGGESGKEVDPNDMDDVEMVAKLGDGAWVKSGMTATTSATTFALPSVAASANAFGESSATFDPLAANANRELQKQQQGADGKKGGEKSGGDMSSEDSRSSSGKQLDESDENNSNGVVRALHKHQQHHHHHGKGGKIDKQQLSQSIAACARTLTADQEEVSNAAEKERLLKEKKNASAMQALLGADVVIVGTAPRSKLSQPLSPSRGARGGGGGGVPTTIVPAATPTTTTAVTTAAPTTVARRVVDLPPSSSTTVTNPMDALNTTTKTLSNSLKGSSTKEVPKPTAPVVVEEEDEAFSDAEGEEHEHHDEEEEDEEEEGGNYWDEEGEEEDEEEGDLR